jgi:hypothetical protein
MGEAKRRKKIDPNYGKVPKAGKKAANTSSPVVTIWEFVQFMYQKTGVKGIIFYCQGLPPGYLKPKSESDTVLVNICDFEKEIIISYPYDEKLWRQSVLNGVLNGEPILDIPCLTGIIKKEDPRSKFKINLGAGRSFDSLSSAEIDSFCYF